MSDKIYNMLGQQLRNARAQKDWSLDVASKSTGVSKAMLGQIERGESSPTVAKLWKIATGFELPLSYFLAAVDQEQGGRTTLESEEGLSMSTLFSYDPVTKIEVFSLTLSPGHQHNSLPHNVGVIEHMLVIDGEMEYLLNEKWQRLRQGEITKFNANTLHGYRNVTTSPVTFHNIICYTGDKSPAD